MTFKDLVDRVNAGEVVQVTFINNIRADLFISKNWNHFQNLTIQDDMEKADCLWIYSSDIRNTKEYNP